MNIKMTPMTTTYYTGYTQNGAKFHKRSLSTDGTAKALESFREKSCVLVVSSKGMEYRFKNGEWEAGSI